MEQDQTPSGDQHDNSRKHERSTRSCTPTSNTKESCRSGGQELQLSTPLSPTCSSGLLISEKSTKGRNLLGGQGTSGISGGGDTGKGLPGPAPYWSVNSSYESIPISALPPKKRYLRQLQLAQQPEVSPPAVPVAVPAQVPLAVSNSGASFGQKRQDNSLGPINWRSTRWWNYRKKSSDDADNTKKKDAANEAGNSIVGKRNRVEWGYGLAKYEKEKKHMSNNLPLDGDNTNLGISSESMTATVDFPAALPASSLRSNVQPGCISTSLSEVLQKEVEQKEEGSQKISRDNAFLEKTPSCVVGSMSIEEEKENITEVSAADCVASELSMEEKEYVAADVLARKFDSPPSPMVVSSPLTCFGSQVEGVELPKMDKLVNINSTKNVSWDEGIHKEYEIEWSDDEIFRFTKAMDKNSFDLKSISNYVGTRSIRECKIFFSKYLHHFGTDLIHKANENATVEGEVSSSMPNNGEPHIWSAVDSVPCSMDNAHDKRPPIHDHVDRDKNVVNMSTAQETFPDDQTKILENNPQLCVTSIEGNYSSLCGWDLARSPVESEKELTPIGNGNKVTTEKENPQISQETSEKVIHSVENNVIKTNGTELCDKVNIDFNTNLSTTASEVDSPRTVVSFDLNSPPIVDSIESETCHTETLIGFSAPPLSATNILQGYAKKGSIRSQLPENSLKHSEFHEESQSVSTMQIGTMNGSSFSQADGIMTHVQRIQHPQNNILDTSKDAAKKPSFIRIFGKIFHEDTSVEANSNSKEYDNAEGLTSNVTTNMTLPNTVSSDIPKNLSNVMSSCSAMRSRSIDLIQNQQAGSLKVTPSGMTRDDVDSHLWTGSSNIVNLSEQPCKSSTVEGSRMLNGYPSLSDWTRMMTNFQALGFGGGQNEGGSTRNTMTLGFQDQSAGKERADCTSSEDDRSGRQPIFDE